MHGLTLTEQRLRIVNDYRASSEAWPATARQIAAWAIRERRWTPATELAIAKCADELARAMREEVYTDPQGREVRTKHAARMVEKGIQTILWDDIRTAERRHMEIAFKNRRQQIVGDCSRLKVDVDSFNENRSPEAPIQLILDFTEDVAELEAVAALNPDPNEPPPPSSRSRAAVPVLV